MNGVHDVGGMHGFGPIPREEDEPVFHADWERRMYGIARLGLNTRLFGLDEYRHAIERIPPARYLAASYYEKWLLGCAGLLVEKGLIKPSELKGGLPVELGPKISLARTADPVKRITNIKARFNKGDKIITRLFQPRGHTRIPRYARGKHGVIDRDEGVFALPDTIAHGGDPKPQHVYSVRFSARELWGDSTSLRQFIYIDLWQDYLEPDKSRVKARK
ncbi:MAG: nitrile hydratase subunit beta [Candidatus Binataceae bacterium]